MVLENGHQTLFPVYIGGMPCLNFSNVLTHCVCSLYSRIFCTAGKDHPSLAECSVFIIAPFTTEQEPGHYTYYFHCTWKVTKWQIFTDVTKQAFKQRMCNISWIYQHLQIDWHKPGVCTMCRCGDMWKYRRITNGHLMWTNPDCQYVHICTLHKHWRLVTYARCQKGERRIQLGITLRTFQSLLKATFTLKWGDLKLQPILPKYLRNSTKFVSSLSNAYSFS